MEAIYFVRVVAALIVCGLNAGASDLKCIRRGGYCLDDRSVPCHGGRYVSDLCSGGDHRRCCIRRNGSVVSDVKCTRVGGVCQHYINDVCPSGIYVRNLCGGGDEQRCCLHGSDDTCIQEGGTCQFDGLSCSGTYSSGKCAGNARRRCCNGREKVGGGSEEGEGEEEEEEEEESEGGEEGEESEGGEEREEEGEESEEEEGEEEESEEEGVHEGVHPPRSGGSDVKCTRVGGLCQHYINDVCSGGIYVRNLCSGGEERRCCLRGSDYSCNQEGGTCQYDGLPCSGTYSSGKCAGNARRRCCSSGGASDCPSPAKTYACRLLSLHEKGDITLWQEHYSREIDNAYAYNNIRDACNDKEVSRSKYTCDECLNPGAPGGKVRIDKKVLCYLARLANKGYIHVNEIAGACHSCTSRHYRGLAVDLDIAGRWRDFIPLCNTMGGTGIDEGSHIHCQF